LSRKKRKEKEKKENRFLKFKEDTSKCWPVNSTKYKLNFTFLHRFWPESV